MLQCNSINFSSGSNTPRVGQTLVFVSVSCGYLTHLVSVLVEIVGRNVIEASFPITLLVVKEVSVSCNPILLQTSADIKSQQVKTWLYNYTLFSS